MDWDFDKDDLKRYPHFDKPISRDDIKGLVSDPIRVRQNTFYPFIKYCKTYQPYRGDKRKPKPDKKSREIRYASRRDSYIFSYYRHLLTLDYERELQRLGLEDCVIAYRKIKITENSPKCKCNIDFAKEAFNFWNLKRKLSR